MVSLILCELHFVTEVIKVIFELLSAYRISQMYHMLATTFTFEFYRMVEI